MCSQGESPASPFKLMNHYFLRVHLTKRVRHLAIPGGHEETSVLWIYSLAYIF